MTLSLSLSSVLHPISAPVTDLVTYISQSHSTFLSSPSHSTSHSSPSHSHSLLTAGASILRGVFEKKKGPRGENVPLSPSLSLQCLCLASLFNVCPCSSFFSLFLPVLSVSGTVCLSSFL